MDKYKKDEIDRMQRTVDSMKQFFPPEEEKPQPEEGNMISRAIKGALQKLMSNPEMPKVEPKDDKQWSDEATDKLRMKKRDEEMNEIFKNR